MIELQLSALVVPIVSAAVSAILAACGVYVAISNRLSVLETKMDGLASKVEKHNTVVERTYKLESDLSTAWRRHDELADRVGRLEDVKIGGSK